MKKGLIMDMDGVIIDSETYYLNIYQDFFADISNITPEQHMAIMGHPYEKARFKFAKYRKPEIPEENFLKTMDEFHYGIKMNYKEILNPGVKELLAFCHEHGIKTAVASGNTTDIIRRMLEECELNAYFDYVLSGEDMPRNKPYPDIYLQAIKLLALSPDECIVIEDSPTGIQAAKAAGLYTVAKKPPVVVMDQQESDIIINNIIDAKELLF